MILRLFRLLLSCFQIHFSSVMDRNEPDFLQANLVVDSMILRLFRLLLSCFQIHFSSVRDRNQPVMGRNQPDFLQANLVVECFWTKMVMFLYQIRRGVAKSIGIAVVGKAINVLLEPLQMIIMLIIGRNPIIMRICRIFLTDLPNST